MPNLTKIAVISLIMMMASKFLNMIRDSCIAYNFGTSDMIDAYVISASVPSILFGIIVGGFSEAYIPCFMHVSLNKREYYFCNVMTILVTISIILAACCYFFSDNVTSILVSDMCCETKSLISYFIRLSVFVFPFFVIFNVLASQSQAMEKFLVLKFSNSILIVGIMLIAAYFSSRQFPEYLIFGDICAEIIAVFVLGLYLFKKNNVRYFMVFNPFDQDFKRLLKLSLPLGLCLFIDRINVVVDRWFASGFGEGCISALNYADKIQYIPFSISVTLILSVCFPRLSKLFAEDDVENALYYIKKAMGLALYVTVPVATWLYVQPEIFVKLLYGRGEFHNYSTEITSLCLSGYSIGIVCYSLREIASRILSAKLLQVYILYNTILAILLNIVLNYYFTNLIGFGGIAISTSVTGIITLGMMFITLNKNKIRVLDRRLVKDVLKIVFASLTTLIIWWLMGNMVGEVSDSLDIVFRLLVVFTVYIVMSYATKIDVFIWCYGRIRALFI